MLTFSLLYSSPRYVLSGGIFFFERGILASSMLDFNFGCV